MHCRESAPFWYKYAQQTYLNSACLLVEVLPPAPRPTSKSVTSNKPEACTCQTSSRASQPGGYLEKVGGRASRHPGSADSHATLREHLRSALGCRDEDGKQRDTRTQRQHRAVTSDQCAYI